MSINEDMIRCLVFPQLKCPPSCPHHELNREAAEGANMIVGEMLSDFSSKPRPSDFKRFFRCRDGIDVAIAMEEAKDNYGSDFVDTCKSVRLLKNVI